MKIIPTPRFFFLPSCFSVLWLEFSIRGTLTYCRRPLDLKRTILLISPQDVTDSVHDPIKHNCWKNGFLLITWLRSNVVWLTALMGHFRSSLIFLEVILTSLIHFNSCSFSSAFFMFLPHFIRFLPLQSNFFMKLRLERLILLSNSEGNTFYNNVWHICFPSLIKDNLLTPVFPQN